MSYKLSYYQGMNYVGCLLRFERGKGLYLCITQDEYKLSGVWFSPTHDLLKPYRNLAELSSIDLRGYRCIEEIVNDYASYHLDRLHEYVNGPYTDRALLKLTNYAKYISRIKHPDKRENYVSESNEDGSCSISSNVIINEGEQKMKMYMVTHVSKETYEHLNEGTQTCLFLDGDDVDIFMSKHHDGVRDEYINRRFSDIKDAGGLNAVRIIIKEMV